MFVFNSKSVSSQKNLILHKTAVDKCDTLVGVRTITTTGHSMGEHRGKSFTVVTICVRLRQSILSWLSA